jgi:triphosphatase
MVETELKFQLEPAQAAALRRALATSTARTLRLRARYFDTPDRRLAAAGLALRLRLEGRRWVQTLKGRGDGMLQRLEHEVPVPGSLRMPPVLDVSRHAGTPAGDALAKALDDTDTSALQMVFETDVKRTLRDLRSGGALVEAALDIGEIRAGAASLPVCEVEFELKRGPLDALTTLAARWVERHGLWLDVRPKAERGDRLARGASAGAAVMAVPPKLDRDLSADAALRAIVAACLEQVLANAADLAADAGGVEHVHQARVGLRRLRSALRVFGDWSPAVDPAWGPALADLFTRLGVARDRDVLAASLLPELRQAGAPLADLPPETAPVDNGEPLRSTSSTLLWLQLIAFAQGGGQAVADPSSDGAPPKLTELVRPRLKRLHRQLKDDASRFLTLDDTLRHRTRKRLKRLRYSVEFVSSLYDAKDVKRYLSRLKPAQDALGNYNDLTVAEAAFRALLEADPRAWFALGWFAAHRAQLLHDAAAALEGLSGAPKFW